MLGAGCQGVVRRWGVPTITASTTVAARVEDVFAYAADYRHASSIVPGLTAFTPLGDETSGLGATFAAAIEIGPNRFDTKLAITTFEPDRAIAWRTTTSPTQSLVWRFEKEDDGTGVVFELGVEFPGGLAGNLLGITLEPVLRGRARDAVANLKREVEASLTADSP
jgi:ribosome-associated toxin RatA of RatAB toxin-antitoxin module